MYRRFFLRFGKKPSTQPHVRHLILTNIYITGKGKGKVIPVIN